MLFNCFPHKGINCFNANVCFLGDVKVKLKEFLDYVTEVCMLEGDETLCNACNQGIAFSSGHYEFIYIDCPSICSTLSLFHVLTHLFIHPFVYLSTIYGQVLL